MTFRQEIHVLWACDIILKFTGLLIYV